MNISAVILAAGFSSRMNAFKPLLPVGDKPMIQRAIESFQTHRLADIVVVTGHNRNQIEPVIRKTGAHAVFNPDFQSGMLSSIQKGIRNIRPDSQGFFLLPVDIPAVRSGTVQLMLRQFKKHHSHVIIPHFEDIPGHPPLIPGGLKKKILNLQDGSALRDLLLSPKIPKISLNVHDRGVLMDADDETGYKQICRKIQSLHIPDKEECLSIIDEWVAPENGVRTHLADVAVTALKIALSLTDRVNPDLVIAAGLLHDIRRGEKDHADAAANVLDQLGFSDVSRIVAQHMDITEPDVRCPVTETEVVYFADKICNGHGIDLNYHKRFAGSVMKFPWAMTSISRRYEHTRLIQARIEASAGKPVKEILA